LIDSIENLQLTTFVQNFC